jgi:hypothetical protein
VTFLSSISSTVTYRALPTCPDAQTYSKASISTINETGSQASVYQEPDDEKDKWAEPVLVELLRLRVLKYGLSFELDLDIPSLYEDIARDLFDTFSFTYSVADILAYLSAIKTYYLEGMKLIQENCISPLPNAWFKLHEIFLQEARMREEQRIVEAKVLNLLFALDK